MKKLLLIILLSNFYSLGYSQVLTNTIWTVYDDTNNFLGYFRFNNDSVSNSIDNIIYDDLATYSESGSNFTIVDVAGTGSPCLDTGYYTFSIQFDTLRFILINDPCVVSQRPTVLADFHWVRLITDITENPPLQNQFTVYPNPFNFQTVFDFNEIQIGTTIKIVDMNGRVIRRINFDGKQLILEKEDMESGVYFALIEAENKIISYKKIIVQ